MSGNVTPHPLYPQETVLVQILQKDIWAAWFDLDEFREQKIFLYPNSVESQTDQRLEILYFCLKSKYCPLCFITECHISAFFLRVKDNILL